MVKTVIYLRVSTEEQNAPNQKKDCEALAKQLNILDYEIYEEQKSAYKDNVVREKFEEIKKGISTGVIKNIIVWDYDRLFRNRLKTIDFMRNYGKLGLKVYSVRQNWFQEIEKMPEPFNDMMKEIMLQFVGWIAEEESKKKSERILLAVRKKCPKCGKINQANSCSCGEDLTNILATSYKGKRWGRRNLSDKIKAEVRALAAQKKSYKEISSQIFYWDKNNNKKFISKAMISKILNNKDG